MSNNRPLAPSEQRAWMERVASKLDAIADVVDGWNAPATVELTAPQMPTPLVVVVQGDADVDKLVAALQTAMGGSADGGESPADGEGNAESKPSSKKK